MRRTHGLKKPVSRPARSRVVSAKLTRDWQGDITGVITRDVAGIITSVITGDTMDSVWLSYADMAKALRITAASAKRLAIRRGWAKKIGNDGQALVCVPSERLQVPEKIVAPATGDITGDVTKDITGDARALIAHLESRVAELKGELQEARTAAADMTGELHDARAEMAKAASALQEVQTLLADQRERAIVLESQIEAERRMGAAVAEDRNHWREQASRPWWRRIVG